MFRAFNPSKCTHTWSSGQPTLRHPGSSWGFGALLKGLTSVVDNSCRSRDSNPQPRITSPTLYPLGHDCPRGSLALLQERSPFQTNSFDCARALCPPTTTTYSVGRWRRPAVLDPRIRIQMAIYDDTVGLESFMQKANRIAQ